MNVQIEKRKRGRPAKNAIQNTTYVPSIINFDQIVKLKNLDINPKMLGVMKSETALDALISHEHGVPCATNIMCIGDPGVGKTTVLLDLLAQIQKHNPGKRCLFISGEMGKKQMFKYTERFKHFGTIETLFMSDFMNYNTKDVIEQILEKGWDLVLIDSIAEIMDGVRDDNGWDRKMSESWLVDVCTKNNNGENNKESFTSFLLIQQVTKGGDFVGSNKLKHLTDAMMEMRKESEREGAGSYIQFLKNRNGDAGIKFGFQLTNNSVYYGTIVDDSDKN